MIKAVNGLFYAVYEKEHREKTMVNIITDPIRRRIVVFSKAAIWVAGDALIAADCLTFRHVADVS